jgi:hypothetical protein
VNTVQNTANTRLHNPSPQIINFVKHKFPPSLSFPFISNTPHHYHSNALRKEEEEVKKTRSFSDALIIIIIIISSSSSHPHPQ